MLDPSEIERGEFRPLRREEYHRLGELGYFEDEHVELLEGVVVQMSPIGVRHNGLEGLLNELLVKAIPPHLIVLPNGSFAASDISEPEPDLAVVPRATISKEIPTTAVLIVEVAESSLRKDRGVKARIYATAGVPDYWVIDAKNHVIHVHRDPDGDRYRTITRHDQHARIQPLLLPNVTICLDDVLK